MSRPEARIGPSGWEASGPTPPPAPAVRVHVVAERLSLQEAHAAEVAEAERRAADLRRADLRDGRRDGRREGPVLTPAPPTAPVAFFPATSVPTYSEPAASVPTYTVGASRPAVAVPAPSVPIHSGPNPAVAIPSPVGLARVAQPELVPVDPPTRRSGLTELFALISGRRRTGRHRPDCVRRQSWSMFSPGHRPRRRGRFRARV